MSERPKTEMEKRQGQNQRLIQNERQRHRDGDREWCVCVCVCVCMRVKKLGRGSCGLRLAKGGEVGWVRTPEKQEGLLSCVPWA